MNFSDITSGLRHTMEFIIEDQHIAGFLGSGSVEVLATPSLILFMEQTCRLLIRKKLPDDFVTVGTRVDIKHLAPAKKGDIVKIDATLKKIEGNHLILEVLAYCNDTKIGEGIHERHIVNKERFMKKLT